MDSPETAVSLPQPFLNCHKRPLSTQSSVILQHRLLNTPLWLSQVICWTGYETCAEFPRLQCLASVRRRFAPRLNMCNIKHNFYLALLYLLLNLNYVYFVCVYVYLRELNSNSNGKYGLHSPCIHCNMNRLRGVWAYIDLTTSTVKRKKILRSILSCFPFEMCELRKLKAITLMFLLVGFFLCYLFAIMFCGNLTSL